MLKSLLGIGLLGALLMVSGPSMAAVPDGPALFDVKPADSMLPSDCLASFDADAAILFVEADSGCDLVMAEITGMCLVLAEPALALDVVAVFDPAQGISCSSNGPSPPG